MFINFVKYVHYMTAEIYKPASTGPSNTSHFLSSLVDEAISLNVFATTPSDHSCDTGSKHPYNCPIVIAFGLTILYVTRFSINPGVLLFFMSVSAAARHWISTQKRQ